MAQEGSPSGSDWFSMKRENIIISGLTPGTLRSPMEQPHSALLLPQSPHGPALRTRRRGQAQPHSSTIMLGTSRLTMLYSSSK